MTNLHRRPQWVESRIKAVKKRPKCDVTHGACRCFIEKIINLEAEVSELRGTVSDLRGDIEDLKEESEEDALLINNLRKHRERLEDIVVELQRAKNTSEWEQEQR